MSKSNKFNKNKNVNQSNQGKPEPMEYYCHKCKEYHPVNELCPVIGKKVGTAIARAYKNSQNNIQLWGSLYFECLKHHINFYEVVDEIVTDIGYMKAQLFSEGKIIESSEFILNYFASYLNMPTEKILHTEKYLAKEYKKLLWFSSLDNAEIENGKMSICYEAEIDDDLYKDFEPVWGVNEKKNIGFSGLSAYREYNEWTKSYVYSLVLHCETRYGTHDNKNPGDSVSNFWILDGTGSCCRTSFTLLQETEGVFAEEFEDNLEFEWTNDCLCKEMEAARADELINKLLVMNTKHEMEWTKTIRKNGINNYKYLRDNEEFIEYNSEILSLKGERLRVRLVLHHIDISEDDMKRLYRTVVVKNNEKESKKYVESGDFAYLYRETVDGYTWRYGLTYEQVKKYYELKSLVKQGLLNEQDEGIKEYSKPDERLHMLASLIDADISYKEKFRKEFWEYNRNIENEYLKNTIGIKEIDFDSVICQTNIMSCRHREHEIEDYTVLIPVMTHGENIEEREIKIYKTYAGYCKKCGVFFMFKSDFYQMLKFGRPLCTIVDGQNELENIGNNVDNNNFKYKSQSVLFTLGYNVQQQNDLTENERQYILKGALDNKLISLSDAIEFLGWLIRTRETQKKYKLAVEKWQVDLEFIKKYKEEGREKIMPSTIIIK